MNPRVGLGIFAACLLGTALFWWLQPTPVAPGPPLAAPEPRPVAKPVVPTVGPRIYSLPHKSQPAPTPAPPAPNPAPLSIETHTALASATNRAIGAGWQDCVAPWLEQDPVDEDTPAEPLVVFFDMVDGRLSDIRLRSPMELPDDLVGCFAEAVWKEEFPEDPNHRGQVSVQRVLTIKK